SRYSRRRGRSRTAESRDARARTRRRCDPARRRLPRRVLRSRARGRGLLQSRPARVHGSRTHHGTFYAPSTVLKTEGLTGAPALSGGFLRESLLSVSTEIAG